MPRPAGDRPWRHFENRDRVHFESYFKVKQEYRLSPVTPKVAGSNPVAPANFFLANSVIYKAPNLVSCLDKIGQKWALLGLLWKREMNTDVDGKL